MEIQKYIGIIKWFNHEKGFGAISTNHDFSFIIPENEKLNQNVNEVFILRRNWKNFQTIDENINISVVFEIDFEQNKVTAKNCKFFSFSIENLKLLIKYLGNQESIIVKDKYANKNVNLVEYSLNGINEKPVDINKVSSLFKEYSFDNIEESFSTIFKTYKISKNQLLHDFLKSVFNVLFRDESREKKFSLWRDDIISLALLSKEDLISFSNSITVNDLNKIANQYDNEDIIFAILLEKISRLKDDFSYDSFIDFGKYLPLISNDGLKVEFVRNLNNLASDNLTKAFLNELSSLGVIQSLTDLKEIDKEIEALPDFLAYDIKINIKKATEYYILENSNGSGIIAACINDYFENTETTIINNVLEYTVSDLEFLFNSIDKFSEDFGKILLESLLIKQNNFSFILTKAKNHYDSDFYNKIDKRIYSKCKDQEYLKLWELNLGKITPIEQINSFLNENSENYSKLSSWISDKLLSQEELNNILFEKLNSIEVIDDRKKFHTVFNLITTLSRIDRANVMKIIEYKIEFYFMILWYLDLSENIDFQILKGKFIYFYPIQQVRIIKKLFYLKSIGSLDLTIEWLNEIIRADLDIHLNNDKLNSEIILDLSTDVIINSLLKFIQTGSFLVESDLLSIVLRDLGNDKTKRFQISEYFDYCEGRMIGEYNWKTNGEIKKIPFAENKFYYAISFKAYEEYTNRRTGHTTTTRNSQFELLKEAVKNLPERKWNPTEEHWGIPSKHEEKVLNFALEHKFFLHFGNGGYTDNPHLIEYTRKEIPNGIRFCEGQIAQNIHYTHKKKFWWCANQECFENIENLHSNNEWENYTLLDFLNILGLNVVESGAYGTFDIGHYNKYISHINRFNQLLEKIYCEECKHILYPVESSNYAAYTVVKFQCKNEKCNKYHEVIYLNHCLNGKCNAIIDSRVSKKCTNGLYICEKCGACCSHAMFKRRLDALQTTGGLLPADLIRKVNNKEGHLERAEYFCHKCGDVMRETNVDIFNCNKCDVTYDTGIFRFKRENKSLRPADYPTGSNNNLNDTIV